MNFARALTTWGSPGGNRGKLLTFFFHRVLEQPDPMMPGEPDAALFDRILTWIGQQFVVLHPLEACDRLVSGTLPSRAAMISFDDGYRDNHDVALPLLNRHGMKAAFFIATGYLGGGVQFNDRLTEALRDFRKDAIDARWLGLGTLPAASLETKLLALERLREKIKYLQPDSRSEAVERVEALCDSRGQGLQRGRVMMTPAEVRALAHNGMEVGGHTVMHPILLSVNDETASTEISRGREDLASILVHPPTLFAYPNGRPRSDFDQRHVAMVRQAGFSFAFSTERGVATSSADPLVLPRFMPWDSVPWRFKLRALRVTVGL